MVLVYQDKIINPNGAWGYYFNPSHALIPFAAGRATGSSGLIGTPVRYYVSFYLIFFAFVAAFLIFAPNKNVSFAGILIRLMLLPPLMGYAFSYIAFKRALNKKHPGGHVKLIKHVSEKIPKSLPESAPVSAPRPLDILQMSWEFLWRNWSLTAAVSLPVFTVSFFILVAFNIKPSVEWLKAPHHQIMVWLPLQLLVVLFSLVTFYWMARTKFQNFTLYYHYNGQPVQTKMVELWQWLRLHAPFMFGYLIISFAFWQFEKAMHFNIQTEPLDTVWSVLTDMVIFYLLFAVLTQYTCFKSRYVIVSKE